MDQLSNFISEYLKTCETVLIALFYEIDIDTLMHSSPSYAYC